MGVQSFPFPLAITYSSVQDYKAQRGNTITQKWTSKAELLNSFFFSIWTCHDLYARYFHFPKWRTKERRRMFAVEKWNSFSYVSVSKQTRKEIVTLDTVISQSSHHSQKVLHCSEIWHRVWFVCFQTESGDSDLKILSSFERQSCEYLCLPFCKTETFERLMFSVSLFSPLSLILFI